MSKANIPPTLVTALVGGATSIIQGLVMKKDKRTGIKKVDTETVVQNGGNITVLYLGVDLLETNEKAAYILIAVGGLSLIISQLQFLFTKPQRGDK